MWRASPRVSSPPSGRQGPSVHSPPTPPPPTGNVYVKFADEEGAEKALKALTNRYYAGRLLLPEYCPVTDFKDAACRRGARSPRKGKRGGGGTARGPCAAGVTKIRNVMMPWIVIILFLRGGCKLFSSACTQGPPVRWEGGGTCRYPTPPFISHFFTTEIPVRFVQNPDSLRSPFHVAWVSARLPGFLSSLSQLTRGHTRSHAVGGGGGWGSCPRGSGLRGSQGDSSRSRRARGAASATSCTSSTSAPPSARRGSPSPPCGNPGTAPPPPPPPIRRCPEVK